jgi:hypothetical protein
MGRLKCLTNLLNYKSNKQKETPMNDPIILTPKEPESFHPVLLNLRNEISNLTAENGNLHSINNALQDKINAIRTQKVNYESMVSNAFQDALSSGDYDEDTISHLAEVIGISLLVKKKYEVNLTFSIDVELEVGQSFDPEWDLDFSINADAVVDWSSDTIWSKEIS